MAYDEVLVQRVKEQLKGKKGIVEKKMFGGVAFLMNGNMAVGVNKDDLIVRVNANQHDQLLKKMSVRTFDLSRGRPMKIPRLTAPGLGSSAGSRAPRCSRRGKLTRSLPAK